MLRYSFQGKIYLVKSNFPYKNESQNLRNFSGLQRWHITGVDVLLVPICCMTQKLAIFVWDLVKDKALEQVQAIVPATMIDRLYNRMDLIVL